MPSMNPQQPKPHPVPGAAPAVAPSALRSPLLANRQSAGTPSPLLEESLAAVETNLGLLGQALTDRDPAGIDQYATDLHRALARAVDQFQLAARQGGVPPALRQRLSSASGQVAAQRESLARATAALDRAMDVLLPRDNGHNGLYSAGGASSRLASSGYLQA
jgi:uncharacterized membrane protein YccC